MQFCSDYITKMWSPKLFQISKFMHDTSRSGYSIKSTSALFRTAPSQTQHCSRQHPSTILNNAKLNLALFWTAPIKLCTVPDSVDSSSAQFRTAPSQTGKYDMFFFSPEQDYYYKIINSRQLSKYIL